MVYIYTSIQNGFDNVRPPATPETPFAKYICYTNIPNLPRVYPWEYRPIYSDNDRSSRIPKILAHKMLPRDATYSIYHDGNFILRKNPLEIIEELLKEKQWAAHRHPIRTCIYEEAEIIKRDCPLANKQAVDMEIANYRALNWPSQAGLWANGFIVRRHIPETARLNELWWEFFRDGSHRDQLSFPIAKSRSGLDINTIDENIYASSYVLHKWHGAFKHKEDNPDFWDERAYIRSSLEDLKRLTGSDGGIKYGTTVYPDGREEYY